MKKHKHAQALGKLGGLARAKRMTSKERLESSRKANGAKRQRKRIARDLGGENEPPVS